MPRPLSEDSPDLEAWLTSTTDGLIQQRTACGRQGITPPTIVINSSMLPGAHGSRRRGLFYIGNAPLPARSTAALFRCLLVRGDLYAELAREGELDADYWHEYAVALSWSGEAHRWHCLPVGELPDGGMSWWRQGALSSEHLDEARRALAARVLVDWRVSTTQDRPPRTMLFNGHLINEPSGDEPETVSHLLGQPCAPPLRWCGAVLQAKTLVELRAGTELTWCYGDGYERRGAYSAGRACRGRAADVTERMRAPGGMDATL